MPKVPVHDMEKQVPVHEMEKQVPVHEMEKGVGHQGMARQFGNQLQAFFQRFYRSAHGAVWGEWTPKWSKYRSGISSIFFALCVAIAPVIVLLLITITRFLGSKLSFLKGKQGDAMAAHDAEKGQQAMESATTDAVFYTSRMFPVD